MFINQGLKALFVVLSGLLLKIDFRLQVFAEICWPSFSLSIFCGAYTTEDKQKHRRVRA